MIPEFSPRQVQPLPLRQTIADVMRRAIVMGELSVDQRLDEQALASKFGVSRIPVREALALLERDGLVRIEPRRGSFVVGLTEDDIHDIYEFRTTIEAFAVRRVASSIDADQISRLASLVERGYTAMQANQVDRMAKHDMEFHRQLVTLSGNNRALAAWEAIADLIAVFISITSSMFRSLPLSFDPVAENRHTRLLRLIERHDVDGAEALLREHLQGSETVMCEAIRRIRSQTEAPMAEDGHRSQL